jgi:hypothetical protein
MDREQNIPLDPTPPPPPDQLFVEQEEGGDEPPPPVDVDQIREHLAVIEWWVEGLMAEIAALREALGI